MTDHTSHGDGGSASARRPAASIEMVEVNGWHAHPRCVGERFCRCGRCHLATECTEPAGCAAPVALDPAA